MSQNIDYLIQLVNKLQDCFAQLGSSCPIDLPQIAVVGEQSAGKSSVLENFVGKDFLPRGSGIVTRCPLVLQLINQPGKEYAQFLHTREKIFEDFFEVRKEIEAETERMTGSNKNITSVPINLRVYSPNVLNLTLVDLPGLTKVAIGDQPKDIEFQIRKMIMEYINNPNCLILAVTPAIIDLANSEALKMSREVDPDGKRTIGVITKIDMMDQGTDCREVLENRVVKLRRGFVGIVNRSQSDILGNKNIQEAQEAEMKFFNNHSVYKNMIDRLGSKFLQKTLNNQLAQHIKETLPSLKQNVNDQIKEIEEKYGALLYTTSITETERTKIFMTLIQQFTKQVDVVLGYQQEYVDTKELSGGSRINQILYQRFPDDLSKLRPDQKKMFKEIGFAIANSQGVRCTIFTPDVAFTSVVKKQIQATHTLCDRIVESVTKEVSKIIDKALGEKFIAYPNLMMEISKFCQQLLSEFMMTAKKHVDSYLSSEVAHINTKHPDFQVNDQEYNVGVVDGSGGGEKPAEPTIYKKGYVQVSTIKFLKSNRTDFLVIKGRTLTSYKDDKLSEMRFEINLEGCKIKIPDSSGTSAKKNTFLLYRADKRNLYKDQKGLEIVCQNSEDFQEWKFAFGSAGISTQSQEAKKEVTEDVFTIDETDPSMAKHIQFIYRLVETYLKIVHKTQVDIVSKICVSCIIHKIRDTIPTETVARLVSSHSIEQLMKEDQTVVENRKKMQQVYKSCKEASSFIQTLMNNMGVNQQTGKYSNAYQNIKDRIMESGEQADKESRMFESDDKSIFDENYI